MERWNLKIVINISICLTSKKNFYSHSSIFSDIKFANLSSANVFTKQLSWFIRVPIVHTNVLQGNFFFSIRKITKMSNSPLANWMIFSTLNDLINGTILIFASSSLICYSNINIYLLIHSFCLESDL